MIEGLTTVLAAFLVFCLYRQDLIKNRTYFYATFGALLVIIFCQVFYRITGPAGQVFFAVVLGVLHAGALLLTMAFVGGLSLKEMGREMKDAADEIRTGGEARKPVIVPLSKEQPKPKDAYVEEEREAREKPRIVIELPKKGDDKGTLPVE
jgi:hypothetical protein